jgi:hypothetical protein
MVIVTECPYCGQPIGTEQLKRIHDAETSKLEELRQLARAELSEAVEEAQVAKREAEARATRLEEDFAERLKENQADAEAKVEAAETRARQEAETALYKDIHEKDKKLEAAQKTIEDLQKKLEGKPAHELGGFQEDDLVRMLVAEFPRDRIRRIPQRAGADIEHEVFQDGESCGVIVYESKNAASWSNEWVSKLRADALAHGASACILVTQAFPGKTQDFTSVDGVPVIHPRFLVSLVRVVRSGLVQVKVQELSQDNKGYKLEQLMSYLNGPDFRNRMNAVCTSVIKLEEIQQKERVAHDKTWRDQSALFKAINTSSNEIDDEIRAVLLGR